MLDKNQFQKEQNELLKAVLDARFFSPWSEAKYNDPAALVHDAKLEIFITNTCNQSCEYCYLIKNPGLYPADKRDPALIINNLKLLYDFILKNNYHIPLADIFTGEIWHTQLGLDFFETTLQYLKKGMRIDQFLIASNCSFVYNDKARNQIQNYINQFQIYNSCITYSISIDGKIIEEQERPLNNGMVKNDDYYDKIFTFAKYNGYNFHPMVAANSVKYWIENYQWWESQFEKWDMDINSIMMLEVRNAEWTEENIRDYLTFLNYLIDNFIKKYCNNDPKLLANAMMRVRNPKHVSLSGYIPWIFTEADDFLGCSISENLTVRLGDLAICPCHRTAYNKYLYGKFIVKNGEIVDIEANNPQMAIKVLLGNIKSVTNRCDTCLFRDYCLKFCLGSSLESLGDPFIPDHNICTFFHSKYSFLIKKYKELGIIDYYRTISPFEMGYNRVEKFLNMVDTWEERYELG